MRYILDFDRTLFDVEALYDELERLGISEKAGTIESLDVLGDIRRFLFADAHAFISSHQKDDMYIVSSTSGISGNWQSDYQVEKIRRCGIEKDVAGIMVVSEGKRVAIEQVMDGIQDSFVYIDDLPKHLELVAAAAIPNLQIVLIDRNGVRKHGAFPVISDLTSLDGTIE